MYNTERIIKTGTLLTKYIFNPQTDTVSQMSISKNEILAKQIIQFKVVQQSINMINI